MPSLALNPAEVYHRNVDFKQPGEKITYTELDVGFIMDEQYDAYAEIYSWMARLAGVPGVAIEEKDRRVLTCNAEVILLDNKQRQVRKFVMHDAWPTNLGAIPMESTGEASNVKSVLTMAYNYMTIEPDTKNMSNLGDMRYDH